MLDKETLVAWDKRYLWHPFTQMQDWLTEDVVIIERGEGCYLIDIAGNRTSTARLLCGRMSMDTITLN